MNAEFSIANRKIGPGYPPYIIAEMSANHGRSIERAKRIIDLSVDAGADAIKFQAYTAGSLTIDSDKPDFIVQGDNPWKGRRLYELYQSASTPYEWFPELFAYARLKGIMPFASPFDTNAIDMLQEIDCAAYKIASFEAVDLELIAAAASTGKPLIISTGMCDAEDIERALKTVTSSGGRDCALLKCTSAYPAKADGANLLSILEYQKRFGVQVGLSDHTPGTAVAIAGCALGATLIEKHVIDQREPPTADSEFSMLPHELKDLVNDCRNAWLARGQVSYGPVESEEANRCFRRSLYFVTDAKAGELITRENLACIRPGYGIEPYHLPSVLGQSLNTDVAAGTPLSWCILDDEKNKS